MTGKPEWRNSVMTPRAIDMSHVGTEDLLHLLQLGQCALVDAGVRREIRSDYLGARREWKSIIGENTIKVRLGSFGFMEVTQYIGGCLHAKAEFMSCVGDPRYSCAVHDVRKCFAYWTQAVAGAVKPDSPEAATWRGNLNEAATLLAVAVDAKRYYPEFVTVALSFEYGCAAINLKYSRDGAEPRHFILSDPDQLSLVADATYGTISRIHRRRVTRWRLHFAYAARNISHVDAVERMRLLRHLTASRNSQKQKFTLY